MKLIVKTDKEIKGLLPRDVRNFIASVIGEKYRDKVLYHGFAPSELIFVKPFKRGFEIVSYKNDADLLFHIEEAIRDKTINVFKTKAKIEKIWYKPEDLILPQKGLFFYYTRTPVILSTNPVEYRIVYATNNKKDKSDLIRYIKHRIKKDVIFKIKHYYGIDVSNVLKDLNLIIKEENVRLVEYKKGEKKRQAAYLKFASNYSLPRFVGYKTGLGWGELVNVRI